MAFLLETERLLIRAFCDEDLAAFRTYRDDPEVARYQGWDVPYTEQQAYDFIVWAGAAQPGAVGEWYQAAVERRDTRELIGDVAFHIMKRDPRQAYIGYTFSRAQQGQGFANEAVRALLNYLFGVLDLHRVVAECDVENVASYRLLERLGFRREAHFIGSVLFKGAYASEYHYAMLKREFQNGKLEK